MNNYEKIKSMSVDEMAKWLWEITNCEACKAESDYCFQRCIETLKQWLLAESEG